MTKKRLSREEKLVREANSEWIWKTIIIFGIIFWIYILIFLISFGIDLTETMSIINKNTFDYNDTNLTLNLKTGLIDGLTIKYSPDSFIHKDDEYSYVGTYFFPLKTIKLSTEWPEEQLKSTLCHEIGHHTYYTKLTKEEKDFWESEYNLALAEETYFWDYGGANEYFARQMGLNYETECYN